MLYPKARSNRNELRLDKANRLWYSISDKFHRLSCNFFSAVALVSRPRLRPAPSYVPPNRIGTSETAGFGGSSTEVVCNLVSSSSNRAVEGG